MADRERFVGVESSRRAGGEGEGEAGLDGGEEAAPAGPANVVASSVIATPQDGGLVTISGTGAPGTSFLLTPGDQASTTVVVGEDGTWSVDAGLGPGEHTITLQDLDDSGNPVGVAGSVHVCLLLLGVAAALYLVLRGHGHQWQDIQRTLYGGADGCGYQPHRSSQVYCD